MKKAKITPVTFTGVYGNIGAPSIVMGTGNTGRFLSLNTVPNVQTSTYLSTDAGLSWRAIAAFPTTYEIAGNGGLIVFSRLSPAPGEASITSVFFTTDGGATTKQIPLSPPAAAVTSINARLERQFGGVASSVVVTGVGADNSSLVWTLDFSYTGQYASFFPPCAPSDYERWQSHACRYGSELQFQLRKSASACAPLAAARTPPLPCGCEATMCGYGWMRAWNSSAGIQAGPTCIAGSHFNQQPGCPQPDSTSLRVNPDNECSMHSGGQRSGLGAGAVAAIVLCLLGAALSASLYVVWRAGCFRRLPALFAPSGAKNAQRAPRTHPADGSGFDDELLAYEPPASL